MAQYIIYSGDGSNTVTGIKLLGSICTFTVNPTPSDATVTLLANGYAQVGNSITVEEGTEVSYTVSKDEYWEESGSTIVRTDEVKEINLAPYEYKYYKEVEKTIDTSEVAYYCYYAFARNYYYTQSRILSAGDYEAYSSASAISNVNDLPSNSTTITIESMNANGVAVKLNAYGSQIYEYTPEKNIFVKTTIIEVEEGTADDYTYRELIGGEIPEPTMVTLTINPTPANATVVLTCDGYTQSGNSITVAEGSAVYYRVESEGYDTYSSALNVNTTQKLSVSLSVKLCTFELVLSQNDGNIKYVVTSSADITLSANGVTTSESSMVVPYGTIVSYSFTNPVRASGWSSSTTTDWYFESVDSKTISGQVQVNGDTEKLFVAVASKEVS